MNISITDLSPGIFRIETIANGQLHAYHVLECPTGLAVVDTGPAGFPSQVYGAFIEERDYRFRDVNLAIITHADADHHGGNREMRELANPIIFMAHQADVRLIENKEEVMNKRYRRFEEYDVEYDDELLENLEGMIGGEEPVDVQLRDGEHIAVADRTVRVLHTPGHTRGHIMLYDAAYDVLIGADGFFGQGVKDTRGNFLQPPPYLFYPEYLNTIQIVDALGIDTLSLAHYSVMAGDEVDEFVDESLNFINELENNLLAILAHREQVTLQEAIEAIADRMGSFGLDSNLAYPVTAHLSDLRERGIVSTTSKNDRTVWNLSD